MDLTSEGLSKMTKKELIDLIKSIEQENLTNITRLLKEQQKTVDNLKDELRAQIWIVKQLTDLGTINAQHADNYSEIALNLSKNSGCCGS